MAQRIVLCCRKPVDHHASAVTLLTGGSRRPHPKVYALTHVTQVFRADHGVFRTTLLLIESFYNLVNLIFSWFAVGALADTGVSGDRVLTLRCRLQPTSTSSS
jgi:hypothetical protein